MTKVAREFGIHTRVVNRSLNGKVITGDYIFSHTPEHLAAQADLPGERWLKAISSWGLLPNIKASNRGRILDSFGRRSYGTDSHGYKVFRARINKNPRGLKVHDVIARTFIKAPPSSKHTVDHINGDPSDKLAMGY